MSDPTTRLELALEAFLAFQKHGGSRAELLARHPQFADLLEAMLEVEGEPQPLPGAHDFGEFELLREVGRGGVGVVHEARQRNLDRRVALKVLHASFASDPMVLARFRREANTLAKLDHTGIVRVLDVGEADGRPWLAMEFVEGESLAARLDALRQQGGHRDDSLRRLLEIVSQVAEALHHAHEAGIVHRDVKPNNVLLRADGRAVLGDFGLAREASDLTLTREGTVAGTPYYMSPEQILARSSQCDQRSDVFSLGATLYECITLERPFDGPTPQIVLHRILTREPRDPRRNQKRLPQDLVAIVLKALEKEPERRYQTMQAFADDLRAFLELRPVQARPPSHTRRLVRWARREPLRAALVLVLLAAAGMGTWFAVHLPDVRAGELARREREYDSVMARGLAALASLDRSASADCFRRGLELFPFRGEAIALWCLYLRNFDSPEAALTELERRTSEAAEGSDDLAWMRVFLLRRTRRTAEADALERQLGEPRSATSLVLAAMLRVDGEHIADAEKRRALTLASLATRVAASPRLLLHLQWAIFARLAADPVAQRESAESLLRLWPHNPLALHYAAANLQDEQPARSADLQEQAIGLGLDDVHAYYNLAAYLFNAGRHPDWIAPMRKHVELHPSEGARARFVEMLLRKGEQDLAQAESERWLREAPASPDAMRLVGQIAAGKEDDTRALELLRKAAALRPEAADFQYDLAIVLDSKEDRAECRVQLAKVLQLEPTHERAHRRLLGVLEDDGDRDGIEAELQRWLALQPGDTAGWIQLARSLMARKDPALLGPALSACERADALEKGHNASVLQLKAKILDALHCEGAAAACREQARALGK